MTETAGSRRTTVLVVALAAALVVVVGIVAAVWLWAPAEEPASAPSPSVTATPTPTPTPTPTEPPAPADFAANTTAYDVTTLPQVNVFGVIAQVPVDDAPFAPATDERARPVGIGAPLFADPTGQPVAYVPRDFPYDGTTMPIVTRQQNWVKVLVDGRQAVPSQGNPAQIAGWLRVADVEITPSDVSVVVSISARTVDIVRGGVPERIASDFGWGATDTPTPLGRTFIMTTRVVEQYAYTRGHPIVYLAVQSPTLDGFGGADVAITAFHYHDQRSGAISNGCLRLDADAITRLAELPLGTPVMVTG